MHTHKDGTELSNFFLSFGIVYQTSIILISRLQNLLIKRLMALLGKTKTKIKVESAVANLR